MGNSYVDAFFASERAQALYEVARQLYPDAAWQGSVQPSAAAAVQAAWDQAYGEVLKRIPVGHGIDPALGQYEHASVIEKLGDLFQVTGPAVEQVAGALVTALTTLKAALPDRDTMIGANQLAGQAALAYESVTFEIIMAAAAVVERDAWPRAGEPLEETFQKLYLLEKASEAYAKVGDPPADMLLRKGDALDAYLEYAATGIDASHLPTTATGQTYEDSFAITLQSFDRASTPEGRLGAIEQMAKLLDGISAGITRLATSDQAADLQAAGDAVELAMVVAEAARGVLGMPARGGDGAHQGSPTLAISEREQRAGNVVTEINEEHLGKPHDSHVF